MTGLSPWLAAALVSVISLWTADHYRQSSVQANAAYTDLVAERDGLADLLHSQLVLRESIDKIDRQTRTITAALDGQTAQLNRNMAELKRTDEKSRAYLAELIPAALGVRYARPATTDPVAWRAGAVVQPGAVPAAGQAAASAQ